MRKTEEGGVARKLQRKEHFTTPKIPKQFTVVFCLR